MYRLFTMILLVLIIAGCTGANTASVNAQSAGDRRPFPEFKLNGMDGSQLDSKELRGKIVLINFWASWCGPCRMETPALVELKKEYADKDFEIVGIAIDPEDKDEIQKFVSDLNVNYPVLYSDQNIERQARILGTPTSFLLDRDGNIVHEHIGVVAKQTLASEIGVLVD